MRLDRKLLLRDLCIKIRSCRDCSLADTRHNPVCGEGNPHSELFFIAQAPGESEDFSGRMFTGPSGDVFNEMLELAGIKHSDFYMTNLIKCNLPGNRRPKQIEIRNCSRFLLLELDIITPKLLVPMGYHASRFIFEQLGISSYSRKEFKSHFGRFYYRKFRIYPIQHPASVLHKPELRPVLCRNFKKIPNLLADCSWMESCPLREFERQGILECDWMQLFCQGDWERCKRYRNLIEGRPNPDNLLPDGTLDNQLLK